ncbi:hypothetical protein [Nocardia asteroides]|uniref:hypothetical protein n=1 Tax=Nocardia asteroides TaxID=1824 RepID=UPI003440CA66
MAIVDELERFLDDYQAALAAFDSERSAALWGLPGMILSDEFAGALDSRELMAQGLAQSYPLYRNLGMGGVEHTLLEHAALTKRMARLRVRWHFRDTAGAPLVDSDYEYLLRRDDDGWHAYVAVAIDEAAKLAGLAAEKGIDLS